MQRSCDQPCQEFDIEPSGGAEGIRTPDPLDANEVRYQLRYSPWPQQDSALLIQNGSRPRSGYSFTARSCRCPEGAPR